MKDFSLDDFIKACIEILGKLNKDERNAVGLILLKIEEVSKKSVELGELILNKYPSLLSEDEDNQIILNTSDLSGEERKLIMEYNSYCDQETTLIGMLPSKQMRDLFGIPPKITLKPYN